MNTVNGRMIRSLNALDAARPLVGLIDQILANFPDLHDLASQQAARILRRHTGKQMDPRFVWWHQFNSSSSSARSFTGWQHSGPPQKSMVMTELVIERFDLYYQDAADELDQRGGFYLQGPHAATYDERHEVRMLGSEVQKDLWALDFAVLYREAVERFWSANGEHFCVLAKVNLLGQVTAALLQGRITAEDARHLRTLVSAELADIATPSLAMLQRQSGDHALALNRYTFGEGDRGCLFSMQAPGGRFIAYLPWSDEALRGFDSELAMAAWLRAQLQVAGTLDNFAMVAHSNPRDSSANQLIRVHLQGIADSRSDEAGLVALSLFKRALGSDLFAWLADQAVAELRRNGRLLQDNARLRRAMYSGYLSAFFNLFGSFAPFGWPMTLILLGATLAKVGLDVDTALHATDEQERKSALRSAMLESVYATFNMVDIGFSSMFASLAFEAPPHEVGVNLEEWQPVESASLEAEDRASNIVPGGEVADSGRLRGIQVSQDGSCWITLNRLTYRVRYSHDLATWLVVPADNPFAFASLQPVRLNASGEWELLVPPRLLGGAPPEEAGIAVVRSAFWDTYTVNNSVRSAKLSVNALKRQKALLAQWPVAELPRGQAPDLDARGLDCVRVSGRPYYSYRYGREYFNSMIEYYTSDESQVNDVFRSGVYKYGDEDAYIHDFADSLALLPKSNEVSLYRGGSGNRGTSGANYRAGELGVGDVLVNTDLTSFTENPYKVAEFASLPDAQVSGAVFGRFDDSSVVFELPAGQYHHATPISAFSLYWDEAESLFLPGHYFLVEGLEEVKGEHYRFIKVTLRQITKPASGPVYDLRTGLLFDDAGYRSRFKSAALVERFFPT
ncbi:dermonecrotic toxin domain-containing protein [Pseudomonas sp. NPDC089422]|uniref:dermonecrotic toxin domain-containing protein n=1 Tax=Pseudomonas sp. NPDC089422 TaxID=3364466 RepID=UPI0037F699BB